MDSRELLKDQAKEAIDSMGKIMEQANSMWHAVRLRIQLFRGFSLTRCQAAIGIVWNRNIMEC